MKRSKLKQLSMSAALIAVLAGGAMAQDTPTATEGEVEAPAILEPTFTTIEEMTVADVLGIIVYDPAGDTIGEIDYVVNGINGPEGVIGIGGFLGLGEYTVAIPMSDFTLREDGRSFELGTSKEALEQTPEFDETGAESLPDETVIGALMANSDSMGGDGAATDEGSMTDESMGDDGVASEEGAATDDTMSDDGAATDDGSMSEEGTMTDDSSTTEETTTQ